MAGQWAEVCGLPPSLQRPIRQLYENSDIVPIYVRELCASFLEDKYLRSKETPTALEYADEVERQAQNFGSHSMSLWAIAMQIRERYSKDFSSCEVTLIVRQCLEEEQVRLERVKYYFEDFMKQFFAIRSNVVKLCATSPDALSSSEWDKRPEFLNFNGWLRDLTDIKLRALETAFDLMYQDLRTESDLLGNFANLKSALNQVAGYLNNIASKWKESIIFPRQEPASIFFFNFIQICLVEILKILQALSKIVDCPQFLEVYSHLMPAQAVVEFNNLYETLSENFLRVQIQPPHIINKDKAEFAASVQTLFSTVDECRAGREKIFMTILTERDKRTLHTQRNLKSPVDIKISNSHINFDKAKPCSTRSNCSTVSKDFDSILSFANGKITLKRRRGGKKVMAGKYYVLFHTDVKLPSGKKLKVWCVSAPFVWSVHGSQNCEGWGTIFWSSYAHPPEASLMSDPPPKVLGLQLRLALKNVFKDVSGATRDLEEDDLDYLVRQICDVDNYPDVVQSAQLEVEAAWIFEPKSTNKDSFWTWFYSIMGMLKKDTKLIEYWNSGLILGFIERDEFEPTSAFNQLLRRCPQMEVGAFYLRFPETQSGKICLCRLEKFGADGTIGFDSTVLAEEKSLAWQIHNAQLEGGTEIDSHGNAVPKKLTNVIKRRWNAEKGRSELQLVAKEANEAFGPIDDVLHENPNLAGAAKGKKSPYKIVRWILQIGQLSEEPRSTDCQPMEF